MWNFKNATKVIIRGGVANEGTSDNKLTTDDPAAAMLGSILVPNGSFESHVSTNGRVYVGQDFMMYNPTAIGYEEHWCRLRKARPPPCSTWTRSATTCRGTAR